MQCFLLYNRRTQNQVYGQGCGLPVTHGCQNELFHRLSDNVKAWVMDKGIHSIFRQCVHAIDKSSVAYHPHELQAEARIYHLSNHFHKRGHGVRGLATDELDANALPQYTQADAVAR